MLRLVARTAVGTVAAAARATSSVTLASTASHLRIALLPVLQQSAESTRSSGGTGSSHNAESGDDLTHMLGFEALGPIPSSAGPANETLADRLKRWLRDARPNQAEPAAAVKNVELTEDAADVDDDVCDEEAVDVGSGRRGAAARPSWMGGIWLAVPKRKPSYARKRRRQMNPLYANEKTLDVRQAMRDIYMRVQSGMNCGQVLMPRTSEPRQSPAAASLSLLWLCGRGLAFVFAPATASRSGFTMVVFSCVRYSLLSFPSACSTHTRAQSATRASSSCGTICARATRRSSTAAPLSRCATALPSDVLLQTR